MSFVISERSTSPRYYETDNCFVVAICMNNKEGIRDVEREDTKEKTIDGRIQ